MPNKVNIDDIAKAAFVSRSVVSRVINNRPYVSQDARARVQEIIKRYGYAPSSAARSLALDKTHQISILAPRLRNDIFANAFWSLTFLGLSEACIRRGYFASLNVISQELDPALKHQILKGHSMDGFCLIGQSVAAEAAEVIDSMNKPMVILGHDTQNTHLPSVDVDNVNGAYVATRYLIELGHVRIGLIAGNLQAQAALDRVNGFKRAHREHDLEPAKALTYAGEFSHRTGYRCMQRLLLHRPTAVFCTSDAQAMGALLAISEAGLRVPQDVSVIGYDDVPSARYTVPPLTTIQQPIYTMGQRAANLLIDLVEGKRKGAPRQLLQPILIERESCGAPAVGRVVSVTF